MPIRKKRTSRTSKPEVKIKRPISTTPKTQEEAPLREVGEEKKTQPTKKKRIKQGNFSIVTRSMTRHYRESLQGQDQDQQNHLCSTMSLDEYQSRNFTTRLTSTTLVDIETPPRQSSAVSEMQGILTNSSEEILSDIHGKFVKSNGEVDVSQQLFQVDEQCLSEVDFNQPFCSGGHEEDVENYVATGTFDDKMKNDDPEGILSTDIEMQSTSSNEEFDQMYQTDQSQNRVLQCVSINPEIPSFLGSEWVPSTFSNVENRHKHMQIDICTLDSETWEKEPLATTSIHDDMLIKEISSNTNEESFLTTPLTSSQHNVVLDYIQNDMLIKGTSPNSGTNEIKFHTSKQELTGATKESKNECDHFENEIDVVNKGESSNESNPQTPQNCLDEAQSVLLKTHAVIDENCFTNCNEVLTLEQKNTNAYQSSAASANDVKYAKMPTLVSDIGEPKPTAHAFEKFGEMEVCNEEEMEFEKDTEVGRLDNPDVAPHIITEQLDKPIFTPVFEMPKTEQDKLSCYITSIEIKTNCRQDAKLEGCNSKHFSVENTVLKQQEFTIPPCSVTDEPIKTSEQQWSIPEMSMPIHQSSLSNTYMPRIAVTKVQLKNQCIPSEIQITNEGEIRPREMSVILNGNAQKNEFLSNENTHNKRKRHPIDSDTESASKKPTLTQHQRDLDDTLEHLRNILNNKDAPGIELRRFRHTIETPSEIPRNTDKGNYLMNTKKGHDRNEEFAYERNAFPTQSGKMSWQYLKVSSSRDADILQFRKELQPHLP